MTALIATSGGDALDVETLPTVPGLAGLYARGAASSGRMAAGRLTAGLPVLGGTTAHEQPLTLPTVAYRVSEVHTRDLGTHLRDYQRLLHEPGSDALPGGYLHVLAFPLATAVMVRADFPLPLIGLIHLANDVSLLRPVRLGDVLEVRAWAESLRPHRRGVQVDLVAEVRVDDEPAWRGLSTYLAKGFSLDGDGAGHAGEDAEAGTGGDAQAGTGGDAQAGTGDRSGNADGWPGHASGGTPAGGDGPPEAAAAGSGCAPEDGSGAAAALTGAAIVTGATADAGADATTSAGAATVADREEPWTPPLPTGRWVLPGGTGRAYAALSGDRNPIHLSALSAKAFGFPRAIAHGMYTAARALAEVGPRRGPTYRWQVGFAKPVLLPTTVDVAITPVSPEPADGFTFVGWNATRRLRHFSGSVTPLT